MEKKQRKYVSVKCPQVAMVTAARQGCQNSIDQCSACLVVVVVVVVW